MIKLALKTLFLAVLCAVYPCVASSVKVDFSQEVGRIKPMHGVGQPPMIGKLGSWSMMHYLKEAGVPYSRLHDVGGWLGGGMFVDIPNLFPNFDADENDPANYRFAYTDSLMKALEANGVEPFFRLGVTIENFVGYKDRLPPVNIIPPKDFKKWARICEHVIRHYTEGWADGFKMKIDYWEIWNEPDNYPDVKDNCMWRGDWETYLRFYGTVAPYLKSKFPHLKIGGYSSCGFYAGVGSDRVAAANSSPRMEYFIECFHSFLSAARDNKWPLDFFSFHSYSAPAEAMRQIRFADENLNKYGFTADKCERIFNEWLPYVSLKNLGSALQACGIAAELIGLQNGPCSLACIYDARCSVGPYSPLFNPFTQKPHKAYYALKYFNELYRLGKAVKVTSSDSTVSIIAAGGLNGGAVFAANDSNKSVPLSLDIGGMKITSCRITDETRTDVEAAVPSELPPHAFILLSCTNSTNAGAVNNSPSDVAMKSSNWRLNPTCWMFGENSLESKGFKEFAILNNTKPSSKVKISADITPISCLHDQWATIGVSFFFDNRNFWHVALVRAPNELKGEHHFEVKEMRDNVWLANHGDCLKCENRVYGKVWEFSKKYNLSVSVDGKSIEGEVRDENGKLIFSERWMFPSPDLSGNVKAVKFGVPAIHITGGFRGIVSSVKASVEGEVFTHPYEMPVPYGSSSFVESIKSRATGFFRVEKRDNDEWWTIDPLGRGVVLTGVDHVRYQGHWSQRTERSVHHEAMKKKFPDKKDWEIDTLNRLKKWGFNMLGAGCDIKLARRGLVHTEFLMMGDSVCRNLNDDSMWICPNEGRPCSAFPNVFHPDFPTYCDYIAEIKCAPHRNAPWLLGYFIDNELAWWGRGSNKTGLFESVMKKDEKHTAKIALRKFLKERGINDDGDVSDEVKLDFLRFAAEMYFKCTTQAIRKVDKNHLVLGSRFAGVDGAHDVVWEVSGKYCDIVTFNMYPWADIDRNVMYMNSMRNAQRVSDAFKKRYEIVKKPILITEWSFPALDSGLPCLAGAGQRFRTQKDRVKATELFAKTMLATPFIIGYDYFMWVDEPAEGISDAFPEDSNYGLIDLQGEAYPGITSMFSELHKNVEKWKNAPLPEEKKVSGYNLSAKDFLLKVPAGNTGDVVFHRDGDKYEVRNASGLVLKGRVNGKKVLDSVVIDGKDIGAYNLMLCFKTKTQQEKLHWVETDKVESFSFHNEKGYGVISGVSVYKSEKCSFSIEHELYVYPDKPWMLCNVKKIKNIGRTYINSQMFYYRQLAKYKPFVKKIKRVPNLWKDSSNAVWLEKNGSHYFGGMSFSGDARGFTYYLNEHGGQHPDASFMIQQDSCNDVNAGRLIKPGEEFNPKGSFWMLSAVGSDGESGWRDLLDKIPQD